MAQSINNANIALAAQGNVGGTLDLNDAGLSFTPDIGDGRLGISIAKDGATLDLSLDGAGTINVGTNGAISFGTLFVPVITAPKDFSLNFTAKTYTGIPLAGTIYGDGVNDVQATLVNGTQIAVTSNGAVGANLNLGGLVSFNNVTLSGSLVLDPLSNTLTFGQGSTLGVDLGTRHIDITATDNAGGQLILGANGLTFRSAGGDGGLILSVTENGVTRQTNLNFAGEMTYSLDGSIRLGAGTTVTNNWESGAELAITSNTGGNAVVQLTDDGLQITTTDPEAITATFSLKRTVITDIKLTGTATYNSGDIILSPGSTFKGVIAGLGVPMSFVASGAEATLTLSPNNLVTSTPGQCICLLENLPVGQYLYVVNHGSVDYTLGQNFKITPGTDVTMDLMPVELTDVGVYAVNGTLITNSVPGSTVLSNISEGTIIYNGVTYAAGELTIDAAGNGIGTVISADLAGDFLPNYNDDFANALQIVDAGTVDAQLSDIMPDTTGLGEVALGTQADELSQNPQLVIASTENFNG